MSNFFWLTGAQMARLEPFFPKSHGRPRVDDRRVLNGTQEGQETVRGLFSRPRFINRNGLRA